MTAPQARPRLVDADDEWRREIDRLRAFVELRAQAQENLTRAMLSESTARAAEALERRIQIAANEAMAFAANGLDRHETTLRALGRRLAEISREAAAPPEATPDPFAPADAYQIGAGGDGRRLDIRDDNEAAFLADLVHLPIRPGGATRLTAAHVLEHVPAEPLVHSVLPHWRSRLAPGGELVIVTLDGPAWAAELCALDYASLRGRLHAQGRPLRNLFDAAELADLLTACGLAPEPPTHTAPHRLKIVARAPSA